MKTETKRGHKVLKIIGIILLILFSVAVIFFIKGKIHERSPWYDNNYFDDLRTDAVLEKEYSARGSFETACGDLVGAVDDIILRGLVTQFGKGCAYVYLDTLGHTL